MRRVFLTLSSLLMLVAMLATPASAAPGDTFPKIIPLPNGWQPEGIASGRGTAFYAGSLANGAIYAGDLPHRPKDASWCHGVKTGSDRRGHVCRPAHQHTCSWPAVATGQGRVYDAFTGADGRLR